MNISEYLGALEAKLQTLGELIASWSIDREIDTNLGLCFIRGHITFADGSRAGIHGAIAYREAEVPPALHGCPGCFDRALGFTPHHTELGTFPFHKHTPEGVVEHGPITLTEALDEMTRTLKV